jgi:hypothetical protein
MPGENRDDERWGRLANLFDDRRESDLEIWGDLDDEDIALFAAGSGSHEFRARIEAAMQHYPMIKLLVESVREDESPPARVMGIAAFKREFAEPVAEGQGPVTPQKARARPVEAAEPPPEENPVAPVTPIIHALRRTLGFWQSHIPRYLRGEIARIVAELAEKHRAKRSWLFFVADKDGRRLEAPPGFANGFSGFEGRRVDVDGPGIVALVARTRLAYCMSDVREGDPYYIAGREFTGGDDTRSEQAVPIEFGGRLLGVLNQESPTPDAFNSASARSLQEDCIRLVRHLLALEVAERRGPNPPGIWNPDRHGWDIVEFLAFIATQLKEGAGRAKDATHACLWYADPANSLSALATTGYGSTFLHASLNPTSVSMESYFTGALALQPDGTVDECMAGDPRMARLDVDEAMALRRVRAVVVRQCRRAQSADDPGQSGMVLSIYAFDDESEAALPGPGELREVASLLREQIESYSEIRPQLAEAVLREVLYACPDSADQLTEAAALIGKVLSASVTFFLRPRESDNLHVAAATGPLDSKPRRSLLPSPPPREQSLIESGYEVLDGSFTGWFAAKPGRALRINDPRSNALLPEDCPRRASFKVRERLPKTVSSFRRFIGYSLPSRSGRHALGVVRCIRSSDSPPFTLCDVMTLRRMVNACADAVRSWRDWYADATLRPDATSEKGRLLQPLPRTTNRPIVSLAHEILVDVHALVTAHFRGLRQPNDFDYVLQVAVLIEQPGNQRRPMSILAYHSELGVSAPENRFSPEVTRLPGVSWSDLLDGGVPMSFILDRKTDDVDIRAGARIPFVSWCGRRMVRGVLVVDLTHPERFEPTLMADLGTAASKIGTVLAAAGVDGPLAKITPDATPAVFLEEVRDILGAQGVQLRVVLQDGVNTDWIEGSMPLALGGEWREPVIVSPRDGSTVPDRDARRWGVLEQATGPQVLLRVPLSLCGVQRVGEMVAMWTTDLPDMVHRSGPAADSASLRARRIRDIIALWMLWTWSWRGSRQLLIEQESGAYLDLLHRVDMPQNIDVPETAIAWPIAIKISHHESSPSPTRSLRPANL